MPESFYILSGAHPEVAAGEVAALARTYDVSSKVRSFSNVVIVQSGTDWEKIAGRAAFVRVAGRVLRNMSELFPGGKESGVLREAGTFACRAVNLSSGRPDVPGLEGSMGAMISKFSRAAVSLEDPDVTVYLVLTDGGNFLGFSKRTGIRRPRKSRGHPHELDWRLTRAMINLAGLREGETVCDPFCGTGTTLLEAESMGIRAIGIDYDRRMSDMSSRNVRENGFASEVTNSDFGRLAEIGGRYDGIVTDLPYGRASRASCDPGELVRRLAAVLPGGKKLAIMCRKGLDEGAGISPVRRYDVYRHKSLTRTILVK